MFVGLERYLTQSSRFASRNLRRSPLPFPRALAAPRLAVSRFITNHYPESALLITAPPSTPPRLFFPFRPRRVARRGKISPAPFF